MNAVKRQRRRKEDATTRSPETVAHLEASWFFAVVSGDEFTERLRFVQLREAMHPPRSAKGFFGSGGVVPEQDL